MVVSIDQHNVSGIDDHILLLAVILRFATRYTNQGHGVMTMEAGKKVKPKGADYSGKVKARTASPYFVPSFPPPPAAITTYCFPLIA
jgi:hypothetical protein